MQINSFNSERFLKTTEHTQIEINELGTIDTPGNFAAINNPKVFSINQMALATTYNCPDCSNEFTPDHEDLVDCVCKRTSEKDSCIVNDNVMLSVTNEKLIKFNLTL